MAAEQHDAEHGARDAAAAAGDRRPADHDRRNHLHLETDAGVAGNLVEPDGVEHGGESGQRSDDREHRAFHRGGVEPRETRRIRVRTGRVNRAAGRHVTQPPGKGDRQYRRQRRGDERIFSLGEPEPLKRPRQVLNPGALRRPAQPVSQRHHRRERDDDRRDAGVRDQCPVDRSEQRAQQACRGAREPHRHAGLREHAGDDGADGEHRADGDVDLAGDDDQRHPDRHQQDRQVRQEEIAQVLRGEITGRDDRQDDRQRRDRAGDRDFSCVTRSSCRLVSASPRAPSPQSGTAAAARCTAAPTPTPESDPASLRRESARRSTVPACMIAMRSLMLSTSGRSDEIITIASPRSASS